MPFNSVDFWESLASTYLPLALGYGFAVYVLTKNNSRLKELKTDQEYLRRDLQHLVKLTEVLPQIQTNLAVIQVKLDHSCPVFNSESPPCPLSDTMPGEAHQCAGCPAHPKKKG